MTILEVYEKYGEIINIYNGKNDTFISIQKRKQDHLNLYAVTFHDDTIVFKEEFCASNNLIEIMMSHFTNDFFESAIDPIRDEVPFSLIPFLNLSKIIRDNRMTHKQFYEAWNGKTNKWSVLSYVQGGKRHKLYIETINDIEKTLLVNGYITVKQYRDAQRHYREEEKRLRKETMNLHLLEIKKG